MKSGNSSKKNQKPCKIRWKNTTSYIFLCNKCLNLAIFGYEYIKYVKEVMLHKNEKNNTEQVQLVSVEQLVPKDHILLKIDKYIDFNFIYDLVEEKC